MSDNRLLAENTIRRFMKLANVDSLTKNFIQETEQRRIHAESAIPDEDPLEEAEFPEEEGEGAEFDAEMDVDAGEAELDVDPDLGDEGPADIGAADMSLTEEEARLLVSLGERLKEALDAAAPGEMDPSDDLEEPDLEEPALDAPDDEAPADLEDEEPATRSAVYEGREALVEEILKRVTKRIISARTARK